MCLTEFVVESCVYYGCVPWEMDRLAMHQNGFSTAVKVSLPTRQRSGYAPQLAYFNSALMRRITR